MSFGRMVVDKFEIVKANKVKYVCYDCDAEYNEDTNNYEVTPKDGEYVISVSYAELPVMIRLCRVVNNEIVIYGFRSTNDTFNNYGDKYRYLLGYVYLMTKHGKKVDSMCMDDLIELAERLCE